MKYFTILNADNCERYRPLQVEGLDLSSLYELILTSDVVGVSVPVGHSLSAAWPMRITFNNRAMLEFSSIPVNLGDWKEIGQLSVTTAPKAVVSDVNWEYYETLDFKVVTVDLLNYVTADVTCCVGIEMTDEHGRQGVVASGIPTGSISAFFPGMEGHFQPEFGLTMLSRSRVFGEE